MTDHHYRRGIARYRRNRAALLAQRVVRQGPAEGMPQGICFWCGCAISDDLPAAHPQKATADHYTPRNKGGGDDLDNLVPSCALCNSRRKDGGLHWQKQKPEPGSRPSKRSQDW